jgi:dihydroorotate dehydrogenase electron transfer subunit
MANESPPIAVRAALPVVLNVLDVRRENDEMVTVFLARPEEAEAAPMGLDLAAFVPGRFFMVWLPGLDEKPYAVCRLDAERIGVTVQKRGPFSTAMSGLTPGARVGLRGPFGRGFWGAGNHGDGGRVALIGGGCGTAVVAPMRSGLPQASVVQGSRTAGVVLRMADLGEQVVFTDDGSAGRKGMPTEWLAEQLQAGALDAVYTCGPEAMMFGVVSLCREAGVECQACLERYMKCGIGVCGQCECDGRRVCVEGPVFSAEELAEMPSFGRRRRDKAGRLIALDVCPAGPQGIPNGLATKGTKSRKNGNSN